jgi:hypothetical protein
MNAPLVIMVGADKGGTGKTTATRALVDYLAAIGVPYRAFDTEHPSGGLKRFVPSAEVIDIEKVEHQMKVFDVISGVTVIDVRAGNLSPILRLVESAGLLEDVKTGAVGLVLLHILGPSIQSLGEVPETAAAIGAGHFLVKNYISEATGYFDWDGSGPVAQVLARMSDKTVTIPHLEDRACELIDKLGISFAEFARDPVQSRILKGHVRAWLDAVHRDFDKIGLNALATAAVVPPAA